VKIGDILSIVDSAETLNYFSVLDRTPRAILLRTIFDRNQPEMASQVAQLLGTDLVHEVLSACVTPVRPPLRQARAGEKSAPWEGFRGQSLKMDVLRYLAERSPVRVALACVYVLMQEGSSGASRDHEALAFALELAGPFPPLKQWVKLQAGIMALSSGGGMLKENDSAEGFLWEDTTAYHGRLKQLAAEGKYAEAIALADCWLPSGAPDWVLHEAAALELNEAVLCEAPPERAAAWASICDKILRLCSTETVAKFMLECAEHLPPGPGLPVLRRCMNDLGPGRAREEVAKLLGRLELFEEILMVDPRFNGDSATLAQAYASDAAQLASSLAMAAHHSTALKVCRACALPGEVWAQVQGSHLANLLLESPSSGGGAAVAVQFVRNLDPRHVLQVAEVAMKELRAGQGANLEATLVLVEFLLAEYGPSGSGSAEMSARQRAFLARTQTGLKGLAELPSAWRARCRHLVRSPELLVETLLMNHQVHLVKAVRLGGGAPGLCNDAMVAMYAERSMARAVGLNYPAGLGYRTGPIENPSLRRARATAGSSAVFCSFDLDAEEGGVGGALSSEASSNGFSILAGDQALDMELRASHSFACAPSAVLFQSIMSLASSRVVAAQVGTSILKNAAENLLSSVSVAAQGPSSPSRAGRGGGATPRSPVRVEFAAVSAATELIDALDATEAMLPRLGNSADDATREESAGSSPRKDSPERGGAGGAGAVQQCRERLSALRADIEMILTLLSADVPVGFSELQSLGALEKLIDRLTEGENYNLAIFVCSRYAMPPSRVWLLWGCELIRAGVFAEARLRIARAAPPPPPQAGSASPDAQLPGGAAGKTGRAGRGFLRGQAIAEAALEALENSGGAPDPPELQALASQIERMALSRRSGALSADTFLSLLGTPGKRQSSPSASSRRGGYPARSPPGPAPSSASRKAAQDLARAEEAKYYLATYDPGRLVAYLFRHERPQEAFAELAGQTEAPLARAIVVHAVEAEEGPALVAFLERALRQDQPRLSEGVLRGALQAFRDTESLEELFHLQLAIPGFLGRAGETCRELLGACRPGVAVRHLQTLWDSCEEFLNDEGGEQGVSPLRGRAGGEALSLLPGAGVRTHEVLRLNREVRLQLDVLGALPSKSLGGGGEASGGGSSAPQAPAWNILTAGPDLEDRRVLATAELAPHNFEVAYCVLQEFRLEMRSVCLRAVRSLLADLAATRGGSFEGRLTYLMRNVRATSTSPVFDEVALAALQMISEQPAGRVPNSAGKWLVKQLSCAHSQTIGWLGLGKIGRALESALEGGGTLADLQLVAANARMHSDLQTLRKCTEAIEQHNGSRQ
jgi:zinc finger FYVE domain-containing protein 26